MSDAQHHTDIVIVGAGPVGLFAVFEAGMLGMRCHLVDALDAPGGQCYALYPEKPIYDIPGYPVIDAAGLIDKLAEQIAPFAPVSHPGQQVATLSPLDGGGWRVGTADGVTIDCRAVIVAAGGGAFGPNRPPLEGLAEYEGSSVFYLVRRREDFRGKRVVIGGGGDSAVDWALSLAEVAASVAVVHRRDKFRGAPEMVARLKRLATEGAVELVTPYQLAGLEGANGQLTAVVVRDLEGGERRLDADVLLPLYGLAMELGPIASWGPRVGQEADRDRPGDQRDQRARHLRDRRHRDLSGQAEAHSDRLLGSRRRGPCDPPPGLPRPGTALGILDDEGRRRLRERGRGPGRLGFGSQYAIIDRVRNIGVRHHLYRCNQTVIKVSDPDKKECARRHEFAPPPALPATKANTDSDPA